MVTSDETVTVTNTTKLLEDVASLYLSQKFSDITLLVDDQKLYAHKVVLAVRSEYFESLLYDDPQVATQAEITVTDVSSEALRSLLKYIYKGTITISSDVDLTLQVLGLAHQYSFKDLQGTIIQKLKPLLNTNNICAVLNTANLYDLEELREISHSFMDLNASEILSSDCFNDLSQKSMIKLLERSNFFAPEIEIFKSVAKWCKINNDVDDLVIQCIRLSWMTVVEIVSVVWPSKLLDCEKILQAITEIVGVKVKTSGSRGFYLLDENLATRQYKAEAISGTNTSLLLTGEGNVTSKWASHIIDGKNAIVVKLRTPSCINHFRMRLWDGDARDYSYYISTSLDQKNWKRVIDYSRISCRSDQILFIDQLVAQYVKIVGTHNTANKGFHIVSFEAFFKNDVPTIVNGIIRPNYNVACLDKKAVVIKGDNSSELLNGNSHDYDGNKGFTYHIIGSGNIIVQLAQPYMISTMKLLLYDKDDRRYRYYIETCVDNKNWEIAVDRRNEDCRSWQNLSFKERAVVFIRITGTLNTNTGNTGFHVVHFECPCEE